MPTVLRVGPFRFFFYAGDGGEPPHVHVERDEAKRSSGSTRSVWSVATASAGKRSIASANSSRNIGSSYWRAGMSSSAAETREALARHVEVSEDTLAVELADGRTIAAPLAWYPRLAHASPQERGTWRLIGGGRGIHWPALDED